MGQTYQQFKWNEYLEKFKDHHTNASSKKLTMDKQLNEKNGKFGRALREKIKQAGLKKEEHMGRYSKSKMQDREEEDEDNFSSDTRNRRMALSQSAF